MHYTLENPEIFMTQTLENSEKYPGKPLKTLEFELKIWLATLKKEIERTSSERLLKKEKKMDQDRILTYFGVNPFSTNVVFMDKPSSWFLLAKCLRNTCGRMTF